MHVGAGGMLDVDNEEDVVVVVVVVDEFEDPAPL